ncbi:MAG: hypothetical protein ACI81R_002210 [Bradymonadia bacterium]|jgi:hypothetical protein
MFAPPSWITVSFTLLSLAVAIMGLLLYRRGVRRDGGKAHVGRAAAIIATWLTLHAMVATSGVLEIVSPIPAIVPYLALTIGAALFLAFGAVGKSMIALPLWVLVACQGFRVPVELILHALYTAGQLPIQMTWEGRNIDVLSGFFGLTVLLVALARRRMAEPVPRRLLLLFNVVGFVLLLNVVHIALLSAPLPIRTYMNDPPVLLLFHVPYNWIVGVHVFSAMVYHLLFFRAYRASRVAA